MAVRRLRRIELRMIVPPSAPDGSRQFVVQAAQTRETFGAAGHGSFNFTIPVDIPEGETFSLTINCDKDFNPSALRKQDDVRDLSYLLDEILLLPE